MKVEHAEIAELELFEVGTYGGRSWTEDDLAEIVSNFDKLKDVLKPTLVIGHGEDQKLLKDTGIFAAGWLASLAAKGGKLVSAITDVPRVVADLINKKAFRRVSAEIYIDFEYKGRRFGKVLRRVALLGGAIPEVKTLQDIAALYGERPDQPTEWVTLHEEPPPETDTPQTKGKETPMPDKKFTQADLDRFIEAALKEERAKMKAEQDARREVEKTISGKDEKIVQLTEKVEGLEKTIKERDEVAAKAKKDTEVAEVKSFCDKMVETGRMAPAERDSMEQAVLSLPNEEKTEQFVEGKETIKVTQRGRLMKTIESRPENSVVDFSEKASTPKDGKPAAAKAENYQDGPGDKVDEERLEYVGKVKAFQAAEKIETFTEAEERFRRENPEEVS